MTYDDVMHQYPEEYALREADKYYYRFPDGEVRGRAGRMDVFFNFIN